MKQRSIKAGAIALSGWYLLQLSLSGVSADWTSCDGHCLVAAPAPPSQVSDFFQNCSAASTEILSAVTAVVPWSSCC